MITRIAKVLLLAGLALYFTLVVFNNLTDFDSNYQFVRHVLAMDSTFPGNHGMWRSIQGPGMQVAFYVGIIAWEIAIAILMWSGVIDLVRALRKSTASFNLAKRVPILALTLAMLMSLVAFIAVGGEWFLMWQSRIWSGEEVAFRMFVIVGVVLVLQLLPETDTQP
jgi:predicted small integral membrane protein